MAAMKNRALAPCSLLLLLCACSPAGTATPLPEIELSPYLTGTPSPRPAQPEGLVAAETPLPSPTPFTYTVQAGDTMSEIAERFQVSLDSLQAANPEISPNTMSVGQVLKIPSDPANPSGEPTPTAVPFTTEQIECYPTAERGMWCFVLVRNEFSDLIENVSAQVTLAGTDGAVLGSQAALLPLNILPPGIALPMAVYFEPEIPPEARPQVQVLTAIRLLPGDARYLPATIKNVAVQVAWNGRSAVVRGEVSLPADAGPAGQVWVAAVAYDQSGRVVGVRRWESSAAIQPGTAVLFGMTVSSLAGEIDRVELAVEARP